MKTPSLFLSLSFAVLLGVAPLCPQPLGADETDAFLGEVCVMALGFTPVSPAGWTPCNGQILAISSNTALFSLLGVNYGGNGTSTFGLPNLNGSIVVEPGQGQAGTNYDVGQQGGSDTVSLTVANLPSHQHFNILPGMVTTTAQALTATATSYAGMMAVPVDNEGSLVKALSDDTSQTIAAAATTTTTSTGVSNATLAVRPPYLKLQYFIRTTNAVFPPR